MNVYKMITLGTVEEKILQLQKTKKEMFENLIESGKNVTQNLSIEELKKLFY